MRILQIYNQYRSGGGGESLVVKSTVELLQRHGHDVRLLQRDSGDIKSSLDKVASAINGIYSVGARREMLGELKRWTPEIVHVHNLYPLFTPSVLTVCKALDIPVVMTVHNYGLTCPIQTHLRHGVECTRCVGSGAHQCILRNCRDDLSESIAYSVRHSVAKTLGLFSKNVTMFLPVSKFVQQSLIGAGIPESRTVVVPNGVPIPETAAKPQTGTYVLYLGRYTHEKGVATLLAAAKGVPEIPIRFYGDGPLRESMRRSAPVNVEIHPWASKEELPDLFRQARCVVVPSTWNEPCPMVAIEAMSYGLPVVASRVGGLPSIVTDKETGFLVTAGEPAELEHCFRTLIGDPDLAARFGSKAREVARSLFSESAYYDRLLAAYSHARELGGRSVGVRRELQEDEAPHPGAHQEPQSVFVACAPRE